MKEGLSLVTGKCVRFTLLGRMLSINNANFWRRGILQTFLSIIWLLGKRETFVVPTEIHTNYFFLTLTWDDFVNQLGPSYPPN